MVRTRADENYLNNTFQVSDWNDFIKLGSDVWLGRYHPVEYVSTLIKVAYLRIGKLGGTAKSLSSLLLGMEGFFYYLHFQRFIDNNF